MTKRLTRVTFIKTKSHLLYMTGMLIKYQFLKKNLMVKKAHLDTLLDMIMTTTLDHYV